MTDVYLQMVRICSIVLVVIRVAGVATLVDNRIKTIFFIGRILDGPQGAVGIMHTVRSLHDVTVPVLVRGFVVASVWILYAVLVRVLWMSLRTRHRLLPNKTLNTD